MILNIVQPLLIMDLLKNIGFSGIWLSLAIALYVGLHAKHLLDAGRAIKTGSRVLVVLMLILAVGQAGLVDWFSLHIDLGKAVGAGVDLIQKLLEFGL